MRKIAAGLIALASCSALHEGTDFYHDGMARLRRDPPRAQRDFSRAEKLLDESLKEEHLDTDEVVTATANRARSLIELDRHEEAAALLAARIQGYNPEARYEGDVAGLALVRAHHLDPERGYAQLLLAERFANTERLRLHLAWQQARFLRNMGTPKAKAEALRICNQHAGKLDFDAMKNELSGP